MPTINRPAQRPDPLSKAIGLGSVAAGGYGLATAGAGTSAGVIAKDSLAVAGGVNTLKNSSSQESQPQRVQTSPLQRALEVKQVTPQETLNILREGELALNEIARTHPQVAREYYTPFAQTAYAVYNDPAYSQFRNRS